MNYILGTLAVAVVILFLYAKSLYNDNRQLEDNNKLIISGYETSIKILEDKAKFEKLKWHFGFIPYTNLTRKGRMVWFCEDYDKIDKKD